MKHTALLATVLGLCLMSTTATATWAADAYNPYAGGGTQAQAASSQTQLQGRVVTAPAGSVLAGTLSGNLSSQTARIGDRVMLQVSQPVAYNGQIILPAGSQVEGQVASVTKAGVTGRPGQLDVRFNAATLPTGQRVGLSGRVQTDDGTGLLRAGTIKGRVGNVALRTAGGAALGALLGTAMGPLSGGREGKGAIYGTAIGAGLGAASSVVHKGDAVELQSGTPLNVILDQPLTVTGAADASAQYYNAQPSGANYGNGGSYYGY
jgi:hypothetical protein